MNSFLRRMIAGFLAAVFVVDAAMPAVHAQAVAAAALPVFSRPFCPPMLRAVSVDPQDPLRFDFVINSGDANLAGKAFEAESRKLIKYFLVALAVPEKDLWVNLSPYEEDRMIPPVLGATDMGLEMLAQDYFLKEVSALVLHPDGDVGREFWSRAYAKVYAQAGSADVSLDTFNKVWIAPDKAVVYEHQGRALVVERHLKVMLETDYEAARRSIPSEPQGAGSQDGVKDIIRQIILPELEKEVNSGEKFAPLRQFYNAVILAAWYKKRMRDTFLGRAYADGNQIKGLDARSLESKQEIYARYLETFRKGVFNVIREEYDRDTGHDVPRKYLAGGLAVGAASSQDLIVLTADKSRMPATVMRALQQGDSSVGIDQLVSWRAAAPDDVPDEQAPVPAPAEKDAAMDVLPIRHIPGENRLVEISSEYGNVELVIGEFPDGEIKLQALNPKLIAGARMTVGHFVSSPEDVVQLVLILGLLKQYGARQVDLILNGWKHLSDEELVNSGNGHLLTILSGMADRISYQNEDGAVVPITGFRGKAPLVRKEFPLKIDKLLYINHQFRTSAEESAAMIGMPAEAADYVAIERRGGHRIVDLPPGLQGQHVVLYHSTESAEKIENLLLTLASLRTAGVASISLVDTYLGYARQDRINKDGEAVSARTMLEMINGFVDHHFSINVHYADRGGVVNFQEAPPQTAVYNLNGFVPVAEKMAKDIVQRIAGFADKELSWEEEWALGLQVFQEFSQHPIVIVGPDKGSKLYCQDAARELKRLLKESYGVDVPIHVGYLPKRRSVITGEISRDSMPHLLDVDTDEPIERLGQVPLQEGWAFVIDDITDTGGTLLTATYILVEKIGMAWRRVLTGVVHGTLSKRLAPFQTGLSSDALEAAGDALKPLADRIDHDKWRMPPAALYAMKTMLLPEKTGIFRHVSTGSIFGYVIKRIIGKEPDRHVSPDAAQDLGGIDLGLSPDELQITSDLDAAEAAGFTPNLFTGQIDGLVPVILNIAPVNMMAFFNN